MKKLIINILGGLFILISLFAIHYALFTPPVLAHNVNIIAGNNCPSGHYEDPPFSNFCIHDQTTGTNLSNPIGTINPPGLPQAANPNQFVSSLVRTILTILLIVAFIIAFISLLIAGIQFITSGGDPKNVSAAQSKIFWGIIGLVVVLSSFGIIMLVEKVFSVNILSGGLNLPRI